MKNTALKIIAINILVGVLLMIIFYITSFLSGFGSSIKHLNDEKNLFIIFILIHLVICILVLWRLNKIGSIGLYLFSLGFLIVYYSIMALLFEYI